MRALFVRSGIIGLAGLALAGGTAQAATPKLTPQQAIQLFEVAGFPLGADKRPVNRCGEAANPRVAFVDMNDDGKPEALLVDQSACYKPDGRWYSIVTQESDGSWRRVLDGEGTLNATGTAFNGWFVLTATSAGNTARLHYDGNAYTTVGAPPPATASTATPPAASGAYPTDGWKLPVSFAQLSPTDQSTLMKAAGMTLDGGTWKGCDGSSEVDPKGGVEFQDLNGDGRPEAFVTDGGVACYGNTGQGFTVLLAVPGGWKVIQQNSGIPEVLKSHGPGGFADILVGGPGFCFGVWRWNGQKYAYSHSETYPDGPDGGKPCKP